MNYELKVTETNNKAGKFHYQVIDENGQVISERKSNREYVAATIKGEYYFGRLDLIGKGDHGRSIKLNNEYLSQKAVPSYYAKNGVTLEQWHKDARERINYLSNVAIKK